MIVLNIFFAMLYFMLNVYYIDTTEQFLFKSLLTETQSSISHSDKNFITIDNHHVQATDYSPIFRNRCIRSYQ